MRTIVKKTQAAKKRPSPSAGRSQQPIELPEGMWDRIARKAYELWDQRGRQEGNDLRNWLDAEEIVMEEIHEARE
ncbi:MAG TPA: DUF2934 domain-containing protein [Nitrospira sp.]|nr:DUF2934 domain-containing protein [Nitrospira sp.]